ncbi:MAG: M15 family metallopeptidase, partial [Candidatus Sumerlaeaceae bacterium]|nr:M15 family metallopeptidase [Candidatus Sumerlaeaceae bacterium]
MCIRDSVYSPLAMPSDRRTAAMNDAASRASQAKALPSILVKNSQVGHSEQHKSLASHMVSAGLAEADGEEITPLGTEPRDFGGVPVLVPARAPIISLAGPPAQLESKLDSLDFPVDGQDREALVTAIAQRVPAFKEPHLAAMVAPFELAEGETIKPLLRLRQEQGFDWYQFQRDGHMWWAPAELFVRLAVPMATSLPPGTCYEIGWEPVDRLTPLPVNYVPSDLVLVAGEFVVGNKAILLRKEPAAALRAMLSEARRQGLTIFAFSGYRDFATQKRLYLEALAKDGPKQKGTAAPGYSEHQLGTTVDVTNSDPRMILSGEFGATPEGQWLLRKAADFGFIHSYTEENSEEAGYKPEPWHLRYVGVERAREILASRAFLAAGGG